MEPEVDIFCKKESKKKDCSCLWIITGVVTLALFFFVGVLVESLLSVVETLGLGAVIVLLITLGILFIISFIHFLFSKTATVHKLLAVSILNIFNFFPSFL